MYKTTVRYSIEVYIYVIKREIEHTTKCVERESSSLERERETANFTILV